MAKIDIDTVAKTAASGGVLTLLLSRLFGNRKAKYEMLQAEVTSMHSIIDEWKSMALSMMEENKKLRLRIVELERKVGELEYIIKSHG